MIKVLVNGALGRMGSEVVKTVLEQEDMELVAAVDAFGADKMIPVKNGNQMAVATDLKAKLMVVKPDVVVDFTRPDVVMASLRTVLSAGVRAVVGTTGFSEADLAELDELAKANNTGILIAPNFALGAILMIKLACEAAKYFLMLRSLNVTMIKSLTLLQGLRLLQPSKSPRCVRKCTRDIRKKKSCWQVPAALIIKV